MSELTERFGSARRPRRQVVHERPVGMSDASVAALGELSAALETVEHARGHLYAFHRLSGTADRALQGAVGHLRDAGHRELADEIDDVLVGRDVVDGRWSFELVESYDTGYWSTFRAVEADARRRLGHVAPHVYEAELKRSEQSADARTTRYGG